MCSGAGARGQLILTDLFSLLLMPTLWIGRRGRARTRWHATKLLESAGFTAVKWKPLYRPIFATAVTTNRAHQAQYR